MERLLTLHIPHAPKLGLYVRPSIPAKLVRNAIRDYASDVSEASVFALYDNTWLGNAKDGVVFTSDYLVFQNSNLDKPQQIRYRDIVYATIERKRLGGAVLHLDVNAGQATITEAIDFGAHPKALGYVKTFVDEAMVAADEETAISSNWAAVREALGQLRDAGELTTVDFDRLMACAPQGSNETR